MAPIYQNWDDYTPNFFGPPVYVSKLRSDLANGSFLIIQTTEDSPEIVGRIIRSTSYPDDESPSTILVNHFKTLKSFGGNLPIESVPHWVATDVCEILQTRDLQEYNVENLFFVEVAFVFHSNDFESGIAANAAGISNVFICRFRTHVGNVEPFEFCSFPSLEKPPPNKSHRYETCYSSRIWTSLVLLQGIMLRSLSRYSERQGLYSQYSFKTHFSKESWTYLCRRTKTEVIPMEHAIRETQHKLWKGFKSESFRTEKVSQLLRFETESQLDVFRSTLGALSTYGVRKRWARIGIPKYLGRNDALNVVVGSTNPENPFKYRTRRTGVDFIYDGVELIVKVRSQKYIYTTTSNGTAAQCPSVHLERMISPDYNCDSSDNSSGVTIAIGTLFQHGDLVLRVSRVTDDAVEGSVWVPTARRNEVIVFQDKDYVANCILQYNS